MQKLIDKAAVLIEALPYIQEFRDSLVVVKFGGSAMEDPECTRGVLRDIVFMECAGMKPIIVHGGGKAISAGLKQAGIPTRFIHGLRYTCDESIEVVDTVLHAEINADLVNIMNEYDGKPAPLSGKDIFIAEKMLSKDPETGAELDLGNVGNIVEVDCGRIMEILDQRLVPVITPLALGRDGRKYNINADMAACAVAEALTARKLVFLSDVPGILQDQNDEASLISTIQIAEVEEYIRSGIIAGGMVPKVRSAVHALQAGSRKVHMIDGRIQHSLLLEMFTVEGIGTQIVSC